METLRLVFPWPPKPLWPNRSSGRHWAVKNEDRQTARDMGYLLAKAALEGTGSPPWLRKPLLAVYQVIPPDKRNRDIHDNLPTACKPFVDGVFSALEIDDSQIAGSFSLRFQPEKPGSVIFMLCPLDRVTLSILPDLLDRRL